MVKVKAFCSLSNQTGSAREDHARYERERSIFALADGFGGPTAGAVASKSACESVLEFLEKEAGDLEATLPFVLKSYYALSSNVLFNSLLFANHRLVENNRGKGVHERGGASAVAGVVERGLLSLASVGACGVWMMRGGEIERLVSPRTYGRLADPFEKRGHDESGSDAARAAPLMALGISDDLEPEIIECRVQKGDLLLLETAGGSAGFRHALLGMLSGQSADAVTQALESAYRQSGDASGSVLAVLF